MLLTDYSIRRRTTILVLVIIIFVSGTYSYLTLPRESAPDIQFPYIFVSTRYEGASPSDIESLVTFPIERKLKNLTDVEKMESVSSEGFSIVILEFEPEVEIDTALQKVRDKVSEAKQDLPDDIEDDPNVEELSTNEEFPVMYVNISGDVGLVRLKKIAEDMEEDIESVPGVLDAEVLGGLEREIRVEFDIDRVTGYGLTIGEMILAVSRNNLNTPGGSIDIGDARYNLKAPGEITTAEELDRLVVAVRNGRPVYLSDVALGRDTFKDRDSFSRINGKEAVSVKVTKRAGENLLRIANDVKGIVARYEQRYPSGIEFTITSDSSKDIKMMVSDLENNILTALILVLAVIFLALGVRNALLVALAIPLSMLISFYVLQLSGMTLNMVVLFSLILALGMLVDNAIVIIENIHRHCVEEGKPLLEATRIGTEEVAWPVVTSTATTVVAFAPVIFWPGIMGEFMSYLPKTVIIVLTASLFVALVITPVAASLFMRPPKGKSEGEPKRLKQGVVIRTYARLLRLGLRYRVLAILSFFALLAIVIYAYGQSGLGVILFPDTEPNRIMVEIEAPQGTNIYKTNELALQAEKIVEEYGNIKNITVSVGKGLGQGSGPNQCRIMIDMVDREDRKASGDDGKTCFRDSNDTMEALRKEVVSAIVGAEVTVDKQEEGPPVGPPINVEIAGDEYEPLARLAERLRTEIHDLPGVVDLTDDYKAGLPEANVLIDKERAALLGLNTFLIGQLVKAAINGVKVGDYREGEDEYDITARLIEEQRRTMQDILRLRVPAPDGTQVPLTSVARVETTSGLSAIRHLDKKRVVTVSSNVAKGFNAQDLLKEVRHIAEEGRTRLRIGDVKDPNGLFDLVLSGKTENVETIRQALSKETRALLAVHKETGSRLTGELLASLVQDLNKAMEKAREANGTIVGRANAVAEVFDWKSFAEAHPGLLSPPPGPLSLPPGYSVNYTGENEEQEEASAFLAKAFIAAVLLIFLVLVSEFNSVLMPFIIMTSVILSFIGVYLGLLLLRQSFSVIMTGMGVISLAGVVVNNAIVLLDYTNLLRRRGRSCQEAIVEAGCKRFRPVMLTAITTILGLVPMAVGISYNFRELRWEIGSESAQWWGSMAAAVIFGLVVATALTLFVVPNCYSLLYGREDKKDESSPV